MAEIAVLGSSSGEPSPDRACSAFALKIGGSVYQFDAGEGVSSSILRHKIDHSKIGAIFISHAHTDHISGIFLEIQMMHLARRRNPLTIYLPDETIAAVEGFIQATYLLRERMGFEITLKPIMFDPFFRDDNITVYARANSHLGGYKEAVENGGYPNKMQSYSFVMKTKKSRIIYSGDTGSVDDYADLLPECDLLITEGMHLDLDRLFELAAMHRVGGLLMTHLSASVYKNPGKMKDLAAKWGVVGLKIAKDGLRVEV